MLIAWSSAALADNELNSSEKPDPTSKGAKSRAGRDDVTVVPVAGGSSDIGVGGGFFAGLTRNERGYVPFVWDLEAAGFMSFGLKDGRVDVPYLDVYTQLTVPRFLGAPVQLEVRPEVADELALYYYGMGNASSAAAPAGQSSSYFEYARLHPELFTDLSFKLLDHVGGRVGLGYIETWYDIPAGSKLDDDLRTGSDEVKKLLGPTGRQGAGFFRYGLQVDTRDSDASPHSGTFDELALNISPGGSGELPFRFGETSANLRAYVPLFSPRLTLAMRLVGDVFFGDVPFYELSRAVDTYAIGGSNGVRGVPAQRYYGKVKVFGNVEVRARLFDFRAFGKLLSLGSAVFFDGGRVWADTSPQPQLDGRTLGLKYGVGGGLRLLSGTAFVLRGDIAWSPDATPIGGYLVAGEAF